MGCSPYGFPAMSMLEGEASFGANRSRARTDPVSVTAWTLPSITINWRAGERGPDSTYPLIVIDLAKKLPAAQPRQL